MASIGKKLGQFRQWTALLKGEKMGNSQKTETSEEFKRLELETEIRREFTEQVHEALSIYLKAMGKRKEAVTDKSRKLPLEIMAESMIHFGTMLHEDSLYGKALVKFGESHEKIANYQVEYIAGVKDSYVSNLEGIVAGMKEYANHKAKLERRRLDFDAKLNKVHKSRKEKPELEEETRVAQAKYEESLTDTTAKMIELNSNEDEQLEDLLRFMDAEAEYHRKSLETITTLQRALAEIPRNHTIRRRMPSVVRNSMENVPSRNGSIDSISLQAQQQQQQRPTGVDPPMMPASSMLNPSYASKARHVKVVFDFDAEGPEELTLRKGETVNVICEIDDGWWEGEILGTGRIGMFPSNYVEPASAEPPPFPARADLAVVAPDLTAEPEYHPDYHDDHGANGANAPHDEDEHIPARPHSDINFSPTSISQQRPQDRPFSHISRMSFVPTNAPIPATQLGERRPSSNYIGGGGGGGAPATPASPASRKTSGATVAAAPPAASVCSTCGCVEFAANAFRRDQCSNCFHKH
ncbi:hypothetical protein HDU87_006383 [Geranomyces variabilis]|uniref:BAR-domain-containing protein n=1 Tax=Geranomyces variabilis TaxID=109894 RepID=A0AAD5XNE6_9FUNG|nr:hypothetical protein HDU87_006383 [Geranomyces variabilis]